MIYSLLLYGCASNSPVESQVLLQPQVCRRGQGLGFPRTVSIHEKILTRGFIHCGKGWESLYSRRSLLTSTVYDHIEEHEASVSPATEDIYCTGETQHLTPTAHLWLQEDLRFNRGIASAAVTCPEWFEEKGKLAAIELTNLFATDRPRRLSTGGERTFV
ncbi:hypothetical protein SARC_12756 [Sphaeroforma arctica JP610]|uniref:Uncharacterized protein n=1 Tax=Sphaeroforma arctica JP610 TaxID=667725 RepID=A0A0L0FE11_9EUKA|nr:hypothetical protein SARC_12756 [Sphaeroforma arctica JP610]KNC74701.1 hypothetical protein SARC_12756 [Sphaeroforma arctica JP610]|eukprot:XP_014148603.1 hypothetical protein SARC_12756 [Sphaeroforma arctica JP610]